MWSVNGESECDWKGLRKSWAVSVLTEESVNSAVQKSVRPTRPEVEREVLAMSFECMIIALISDAGIEHTKETILGSG